MTIDGMYEILFIVTMSLLALITFAYLVRTILGPHFTDIILAANSISTVIILIISVLAVYLKESYIVDVALIYASLGFITVIILCKSRLQIHHRDRNDDFKNLKKGLDKHD